MLDSSTELPSLKQEKLIYIKSDFFLQNICIYITKFDKTRKNSVENFLTKGISEKRRKIFPLQIKPIA